MICDYAVSLSWFRMQLSDDPDDWVWARTYWTRPGALRLPYWSAYGNPAVDTDHGMTHVGPQFQYTPMKKKRRRRLLAEPVNVIERPTKYARSRESPYPGQHAIGLPEWFADGIPATARIVNGDGGHCGAAAWFSDVDVGVDLDSENPYGWQSSAGGQRQGGTGFSAGGYAWVSAGGQREGGTTAAAAGYEWYAAGGQVQGGEGGEYPGYEWAAEGGQVQGREADFAAGYQWAAEGGQREGGAAVHTAGYQWPADGGQRQGGAASFGAGSHWFADGGQVQGGVSDVWAGYAWLADGGQVQGAVAAQFGGYLWAAEGGQRQGGAAAWQLGYHLAAEGGQRQGGIAPMTAHFAMTAAGGQRQGLLSDFTTGWHLQAAGGQVQGGAADQGQGLPQPDHYSWIAQDGQRQGGRANMPGQMEYDAAGGQGQGGVSIQFGTAPWIAEHGQSQGGSGEQHGGYDWAAADGQRQGGFGDQWGSRTLQVRVNGILLGTRDVLNFNTHTNQAFGGADNPGAGRVDMMMKVTGELCVAVPYVGTQQSTASASYVDLATVQSVTLDLDVITDVYVQATCAYSNSGAVAVGAVAVNVDGVNTLTAQNTPPGLNVVVGIAGAVKITLAAGSHTIKMRYLVGGGTGFFSSRAMLLWRA